MTSYPSPSAGFAFRNVSHSFGALQVLDEVDIVAAPGEFLAIVGPSGCGKTTLLKALAGLLKPTSGTVQINGFDVAGRPGQLAYLPQKDSLLPWLSAFDNVTVGARISKQDNSGRARELFERFGLGGFENAWPRELSGGMRQRVAVLRTFLTAQPALGLDEPFGALDAITRRSMQQWLREMWLEDKRATLLITHDVEEALLLADRVIVISARPGRVAATVDVSLSAARVAGIETTDAFVALKRNVLAALGS